MPLTLLLFSSPLRNWRAKGGRCWGEARWTPAPGGCGCCCPPWSLLVQHCQCCIFCTDSLHPICACEMQLHSLLWLQPAQSCLMALGETIPLQERHRALQKDNCFGVSDTDLILMLATPPRAPQSQTFPSCPVPGLGFLPRFSPIQAPPNPEPSSSFLPCNCPIQAPPVAPPKP